HSAGPARSARRHRQGLRLPVLGRGRLYHRGVHERFRWRGISLKEFAMTKINWPGGARLALSLVVNVEEGAEGNILDGDKGPEPVDEFQVSLAKPIRNFGNETNYQYGIRAGAPRVLKLLKDSGVKATFTSAAVALERAPEVAKSIAADGHEVCAHGY